MDGAPVALTVPSCLRAAAADSPDVEAVVDGDLRLTYTALNARAEQLARALIAARVRPGEAVSIWAPNSAQWIVAALGTLAAGAILVPVNTRYKGAEAQYLLAKARVVLLVVDQGFLGNDYLGMLHSAGAGPSGPAGLAGLPFLEEVFQTGGFNVYPVEVEQLLVSHPMIAEAAVIGVPDDRLGEAGHAFVVPAAGCSPAAEDVIAFARERIANFKVPRAVTVVSELPHTPLGKVQKFRLT